MARGLKAKALTATRLANEYGGWIYCAGCGQTIGYLCYVTYSRFTLRYQCTCGSHGIIYLDFGRELAQSSREPLLCIKNRLCCPLDQSPLVTILAKKLTHYEYEITCETCGTMYVHKG